MPFSIGLTGSFGSGCTYLAKQFIEPLGYRYYSLSDILKDLYRETTGSEPNREVLQDFGNELRKGHGPDYLGKLLFEKIGQDGKPTKIIIDSIRNPHEISCLRRTLPDFYLIGIFASRDTRAIFAPTKSLKLAFIKFIISNPILCPRLNKFYRK